MKSFPSTLERVRIATPCPISWEEMSGNDRVRFCDHCRLNVYNISELSRLEAETLIASTEGRLCARFYRRADGTIITKDCPVGLRALRKRVSKRVAAVFAAIAAISSAALGQQSSSKDQKTSCQRETTITFKDATGDQTTAGVSGAVMDFCGAAIANAEVLITADGIEKKKFVNGEDGTFRLDNLPEGDYTIRVSAPFFGPYVAHLRIERSRVIEVEIVLQPGALMGDVVVVEPRARFETKPGTTIISGEIHKKVPIQK